MRSTERVHMTITGLLVVAAVSVAVGSGRKPPKEHRAGVSLRRLSADEVMDILDKFPEMVPSYLAEQRNDTRLLKYLYPLKEATSAQMQRVFPGVRFYQATTAAEAAV